MSSSDSAAVVPPHSAGGPVFAARGLRKVYGEGSTAVHALTGVDLDLYAGEMVVLLGPSGSGKSTLLNISAASICRAAGRCFIAGDDLAQADEDELTTFRRESVGFVFQFYNLIPSLTARENVALITEISARPDDAGRSARPRRAD